MAISPELKRERERCLSLNHFNKKGVLEFSIWDICIVGRRVLGDRVGSSPGRVGCLQFGPLQREGCDDSCRCDILVDVHAILFVDVINECGLEIGDQQDEEPTR